MFPELKSCCLVRHKSLYLSKVITGHDLNRAAMVLIQKNKEPIVFNLSLYLYSSHFLKHCMNIVHLTDASYDFVSPDASGYGQQLPGD